MTILVKEPVLEIIEVSPEEVEVREHIVLETIQEAVEGPMGPMGQQGPMGPQGPAGAGGASYIHDQVIPAASWVIVHNLNFFPSITVEDSGGTEHYPDIVYNNGNQVTLTFVSSMGGKAYLS
jgi:hypothetical protein